MLVIMMILSISIAQINKTEYDIYNHTVKNEIGQRRMQNFWSILTECNLCQIPNDCSWINSTCHQNPNVTLLTSNSTATNEYWK